MVKHWMLLGDGAFDGSDSPMGVLRFSKEEIKDWQEVDFVASSKYVINTPRI